MASQRALAILDAEERGEAWRATLELACGCVHTFALPATRFVEAADGTRIAAGKYPCPVGHPLARK